MYSENEATDHSSWVVVGLLLTVLLLPSVLLSGTFLLPLVTMATATLFVTARDRILGCLVFLFCCLLCFACYQYSVFFEYPAEEWYDVTIFYLTEFLGDQPGAPGISRLPYVGAMLAFWLFPAGACIWAFFFAKIGLHRKWMEGFRKRYVKSLDFSKLRKTGKDVFLGVDKKYGKPIVLTQEMRLRHTQILGATGYGKTESVLMSMIRNDIENGRGLLLIDGKGDTAFRDQILCCAWANEREYDIQYLDYSDAAASMSYNPLLNGSPAEVRDRIIESLEWSEEYYKKCASSVLLLALQILEHQRRKPTLELLKDFMLTPKIFGESVPSTVQSLYRDFCDNHAKRLPEVRGLVTDLCNIIQSGAGSVLSENQPEIDLMAALSEKKIVIMGVSSLDYGITARTFGRLVIQDLKAVCGQITRKPLLPRGLFPVYIDEFESFAHESFNELLSKARSAGIGITISHQSMGDLEKVGPFFKKQITENTNNKIVLRVNDEETVEYFANMAGTRVTSRMTYQVEENFLHTRKTGAASRRDVEEFIVHPNVYRNLGIGEAVVMTRNNGKSQLAKLDRQPRFKIEGDFTEGFREAKRERIKQEKSTPSANATPKRLSAELF